MKITTALAVFAEQIRNAINPANHEWMYSAEMELGGDKMKNVLMYVFLAFLLAPVAYAAYERVYVIELEYSHGNISYKLPYAMQVYFFPEKGPEYGYRAELIGQDGSQLYLVTFEFPTEIQLLANGSWFDRSGNQIIVPEAQPMPEVESTFVQLYLPYSPNASFVRVYDIGGRKIFDIGVAHLNSYCGDSICAEGEQCEADCPKAAAGVKLIPVAVKPSFPVLPVVAAVAIVSLVVVFIFIRRRPQGSEGAK